MRISMIIILVCVIILLQSCIEDDPNNSKILELGIPLSELIHKKVSIEKLYYAGASVKDLIEAGAPLEELLAIDEITLKDLVTAAAPLEQIKALHQNDKITFEEMMDAGIGVGVLEELGYTNRLEQLGLLGLLEDVDGNTYSWVKIGNQVWMAENLRAIHYADKRPIGEVLVRQRLEFIPYYEKFYIDPLRNDDDNNHVLASKENPSIYYTWAAAADRSIADSVNLSVQGICPSGWRLPNKEDIELLISYTTKRYPYPFLSEGLSIIGLWDTSYISPNNYFGFNAKSNGYYFYEVSWSGFKGNHYNGFNFTIWTSEGSTALYGENSPDFPERAVYWSLQKQSMSLDIIEKIVPHCVRCIKTE